MNKFKPIATKWPEELISRLDACVAKMQDDNPGAVVSRSAVIRIFVERGLAAEGFPAPTMRRGTKAKGRGRSNH